MDEAGGSPPKKEKWKEVVYISDSLFDETKNEALKFKKLMDKEIIAALENNNLGILRYTVNRLHRIKKSVSTRNLQGVVDGDSRALERALKELLLCSWEGPIVKFLDEDKQARIERGEKEHVRFLRNNQVMDPNTRAMIEEGDGEGIRMPLTKSTIKALET